MLSADQINALLEVVAALFLIPTILTAFKRKMVAGVHWLTPIFFTSWGLWNCFYYPTLGQYYSTIASIVLTILNLIWLGMVLLYKGPV